jgi:hypothetical protein
MKTFKQLKEEIVSEISTRSMSKYVKLAEPEAKRTGAVGELTGDSSKTDKANKRLSIVSKTKSKLNSIKPAYESTDKSSNPENIITDPKDRQSYLGHKKMEQNHIDQYRKTTSPIKKGHHQDMIQQHSDAAGEILDKYRKESVELDEVLDP